MPQSALWFYKKRSESRQPLCNPLEISLHMEIVLSRHFTPCKILNRNGFKNKNFSSEKRFAQTWVRLSFYFLEQSKKKRKSIIYDWAQTLSNASSSLLLKKSWWICTVNIWLRLSFFISKELKRASKMKKTMKDKIWQRFL